jgi:alpha-L-rhamnosidase
LIQAAGVLGNSDDVARYEALAQKIQAAFMRQYVASNGTLEANTQTAYVLALHFGLLPDNMRTAAAARLVQLIKTNNMHLATGFLGAPYLLETLSENGYNDIAYALLLQKTYPSWLYPVTMGATIKPDSTVQATSYNHYAYGSVAEWLYSYTAGIRPGEPGFRKIIIAPQTGMGIDSENCSYNSACGKIVSNWKVTGTKIFMEVTIPAGTAAVIDVPGRGQFKKGPGKYKFEGNILSDSTVKPTGGKNQRRILNY